MSQKQKVKIKISCTNECPSIFLIIIKNNANSHNWANYILHEQLIYQIHHWRKFQYLHEGL